LVRDRRKLVGMYARARHRCFCGGATAAVYGERSAGDGGGFLVVDTRRRRRSRTRADTATRAAAKRGCRHGFACGGVATCCVAAV
jgi:hypothetical protein